jgi:hypothetical protein
MKVRGMKVLLGVAVACGAASGCEGRPLVSEPSPPVEPSSPTTTTTDAKTTTAPTPTIDPMPTSAPTAPADTPEVEQSLLARWNAVASAPVDGFDFHWTTFNQFPHPTFKGGSAEAYQAFAKVLLAFFDHGDNFDFLAQNRLFKLHLIYVLPSGQNGFDTNFEDLAVYLTNSNGFPNVPADTRNALAAYVDKIKTVESGAVVKPAVSYETMCRNYCNALAETNIYYCASVGRDCRDEVLGWGDLCYQDRCATMQVTQSLCYQQCATAASLYDTVCSAGTAPAPLCPVPAADHDRACVDGCALPPGS